jgi:hypothetical protein
MTGAGAVYMRAQQDALPGTRSTQSLVLHYHFHMREGSSVKVSKNMCKTLLQPRTPQRECGEACTAAWAEEGHRAKAAQIACSPGANRRGR